MFDLRMLEFDSVRALLAGHCLSGLGRRRVDELQPSSDPKAVADAISLIREMDALLEARREPPIHGLMDITAAVAKVRRERSVLEPDEFLHILDTLEVADRLRKFFSPLAEEFPGLHALAMPLSPLPALARDIDTKISPNAEVRDQASDALSRIRHDIRGVEAIIHRTLDQLIREFSASGDLQDNFATLRNGRYVLPVKTNCRGRIKGILHDSSNTGETVFIEPYAILEHSNQLADLRVREKEEVYRILLALANHARSEINGLLTNLEILADFDLHWARAQFGRKHRCSFPTLVGPGEPPSLVHAHHPLLYAQDPQKSKPLNLPLDPADLVLVISGPNAGGKTTALKTVGLIAIMVQCAIPVPLDPRSRIPVYSHILADIGDEQDILGGLSTFSGHMNRLARIMKDAGNGPTLVLLDELGTATDPGEGGALAVAILETLAERRCTTLVSSHLPSLKTWALQHPNGRNASFRLDERDRTPTFRLTLDLPGISEAFTIAERAGLPPEIIARARNLRPDSDLDVTALVLKLQQKEAALDEAIAQQARIQTHLEERLNATEALEARLRDEKRNLKKDLLDQVTRQLNALRIEVERLIASGNATKEELLNTKRAIEGAMAESQRELAQARTEQVHGAIPGQLQPGDRALLIPFNEQVTVLEILPRKGEARVTLGKVTMAVKLGDLQRLAQASTDSASGNSPGSAPNRPPAPRATATYQRPQNPESTLDLHGMRIEDALIKVDKFIDQALLSGFTSVRVMHGQGTGRLGRALHRHFRQNPVIRAFRYAQPHEGGGGVTIVEF
jgi:DNA mismatch repair protein MutS2